MGFFLFVNFFYSQWVLGTHFIILNTNWLHSIQLKVWTVFFSLRQHVEMHIAQLYRSWILFFFGEPNLCYVLWATWTNHQWPTKFESNKKYILKYRLWIYSSIGYFSKKVIFFSCLWLYRFIATKFGVFCIAKNSVFFWTHTHEKKLSFP